MKLARFYGVGAVLFAVSTAVLSGCAGQEGPKHAQIKAGEMPEGESFTGVYFHPVYGYLHMVEDGSNIFGKWKRADQSRWGELQGTKTGNLVRFTWKEHTIGLVGAGAESKGKGYFLYKTGKTWPSSTVSSASGTTKRAPIGTTSSSSACSPTSSRSRATPTPRRRPRARAGIDARASLSLVSRSVPCGLAMSAGPRSLPCPFV